MFDADDAIFEVEEPLDYISPYKPKLIDAAEYQLNRVLCGGRIVQGYFGDHTFSLCAQPANQKVPVVSSRYFKIVLSQCEFIVELGFDVLQFSLTQLKVPDAVDHLSTALREAVYLGFIESFLGQGFGVNPLQVQASDLSALDVYTHQIAMEFFGGEQKNAVQLQVRVLIHDDFLPMIVEWLSKQKCAGLVPHSALQSVIIPTSFILDEFFVAQSVVESLQLGDVVITDALEGEVLVRVSGKLQQKGRVMDESVALDGYLQEFEQSVSLSGIAQQVTTDAAADAAIRTYDEARDLFQDIPLLMTFQLFQQELTLEQLRQLNTGQCLPIANTSPHKILISVNGKEYAKGELLQIEEKIGVRILEFVSS